MSRNNLDALDVLGRALPWTYILLNTYNSLYSYYHILSTNKYWNRKLLGILFYSSLSASSFSNSLVSHRAKTKKITTVREVWILGLNKHRVWQFYFSAYSLAFVMIEKIYQTLDSVSSAIQTPCSLLKYSAKRCIFNCLGVLKSHWNISCLIYHSKDSRW